MSKRDVVDGLGIGKDAWRNMVNQAKTLITEHNISIFTSADSKATRDEILVPALLKEFRGSFTKDRTFKEEYLATTMRETLKIAKIWESSRHIKRRQQLRQQQVSISSPSLNTVDKTARSPKPADTVNDHSENKHNMNEPTASILDSEWTLKICAPEYPRARARIWRLGEILGGDNHPGGWKPEHLSFEAFTANLAEDFHGPMGYTEDTHIVEAADPVGEETWPVERSRDLRGVVARFARHGSQPWRFEIHKRPIESETTVVLPSRKRKRPSSLEPIESESGMPAPLKGEIVVLDD